MKRWKNTTNIEELKTTIKESSSFSIVLKQLGLRPCGGNYDTLKRLCQAHSIDTSHFNSYYKGIAKGGVKAWALETVLTKNSHYNTHKLKKRLLDSHLLTNVCEICKNTGVWQDTLLVLHLDHKNGDRTDNRLENLRLLCPNCHSQTDTYCGKNKKGLKSVKATQNRSAVISRTKIKWPIKEDLKKLVWHTSTRQLALKLGVSDSAIAKKCRQLGISKPPRGYWARQLKELLIT
jgi:TyrR family helix-turn-helix protein